MKTRIQSLSFLATLAIAVGMISWGSALHAQSTSSSSGQQTQQSPETTPQQPPSSQTPGTATPESGSKPSNRTGAASDAAAGETQTFSGTVLKQGDKYVLKDESGKIYDIDHQADVAKFEGKRVRVQGTLDANGKILVR